MAQDRSFQDLMARLQQGDEAAAARIFQLFGQRLIALTRQRLDAGVRQKSDPKT